MAMISVWLIAKYKQAPKGTYHAPRRVVSVDDYSEQISADGGNWREVEVLGNRAIVKVYADNSTITTIATDPLISRIPLNVLNNRLNTLSTVQQNALRAQVIDMGYTLQELQAALGTNLGQITLRQLLKFAAKRRLKPRYDDATDTIICDGQEQSCESVDDLDAFIQG